MSLSTQTSICLIPSSSAVCVDIDVIRKEHDKAFGRWMPHINFFFPFIGENQFLDGKQKLEKALQDAKIESFTLEFDGFASFPTGNVHLKPNRESTEKLQFIYKVLETVFPECVESAIKKHGTIYYPHLTVGQFSKSKVEFVVESMNKTKDIKSYSFKVDSISMISRVSDPQSSFQVKHQVSLEYDHKQENNDNNSREEKQAVLKLYPSVNGYVGNLALSLCNKPNVDSETKTSSAPAIRTVVILDSSGSMNPMGRTNSDQVYRFGSRLLPQLCTALKYGPEELVTVITFNNTSKRSNFLVKDLSSSFKETASNGTYMSEGLKELAKYIREELKEPGQKIRLLAISDGDVFDSAETQTIASSIASTLKNQHYVNAQAVRLFTSQNQPDTKALASVLQFSNCQAQLPSVLDLFYSLSDSEIVNSMVSLFQNDGLRESSNSVILKCNNDCIQSTPWSNMNYRKSATLQQGENLIWFSEIPQNAHISDENELKVELSTEPLNRITYQRLIQPSMEYFFSQIRILKVVGTAQAKKEIESILQFFEKLDATLSIGKQNDDIDEVKEGGVETTLGNRLQRLKKEAVKHQKTFFLELAELANNDKINQLNSQQQAAYLRNIDHDKGGKGLTKRITQNGIEFTRLLYDEVKKMHRNLEELNAIDDSTHTVSFYSQGTTLEGIKSVCKLIDDGILEQTNEDSILRLINIVGLACAAPIDNDFIDPMTYRLDELLMGCYVSLSDVLEVATKKQELEAPALKKVITNVIPMFDDPKIHLFLRKHAPSLLELTAGVGMRRVMGVVPMTFAATLAAGIWKLVQVLHTSGNQSELNINTFTKFVQTFDVASGKYFEPVAKFITEPTKQGEGTQLYLGDNGVIQLMKPIYSVLKQNKPIPTAVMRSLYCYEVWRSVRCLFKHEAENQSKVISNYLAELLGVNVNKTKRTILPLFEKEPTDTPFHHEYKVNQEKFDSFYKPRILNSNAQLLCLLPGYFNAVIANESKFPKLTTEMAQNVLGITYDLEKFQLYAIVQSFLHRDYSNRYNDDTKTTNIVDFIDEISGQNMIEEYITKLHRDKYNVDLKSKKTEEIAICSKELVSKLLQTEDLADYKSLIQNGIKKGDIQFIINNTSSVGYLEWKNGLIDLAVHVPHRFDKIEIMVCGRDRNESILWNNGNFITSLNQHLSVFYEQQGQLKRWQEFRQQFSSLQLYTYRKNANRHGHGNEKPSYWALGYATMAEMKSMITSQEFDDYCIEHPKCCGN